VGRGDPDTLDLVIENARPNGAGDPVAIAVRNGAITAIGAEAGAPARERLEANGGIVLTSFVEPHIHLDKVSTRHLPGADAATWAEAAAVHSRVKSTFTPETVEERASRALELAVSNGVGLIRAHAAIDTAQGLVALEGVLAARSRWADAIGIEVVALIEESLVERPELADLAREGIRRGADVIGGIPNFEPDEAGQRKHVETLFEIAEELGVPVDAHVDYDADPAQRVLELIADETLRRGFEGRVLASHCCALAVYAPADSERVIEKLRRADITVCISPAANLQHVGAAGRLPVHRGSSRTKELLDAGVNVAAGSDNMNDMWFAFGRLDPVETAYAAVLSAALQTEREVAAALEMVTTRAARALGRPERVLAVGAPADLVVLEAATATDLLRGVAPRRTTIRRGRVVGGMSTERWVRRGETASA
jgi:cytosine deaminase